MVVVILMIVGITAVTITQNSTENNTTNNTTVNTTTNNTTVNATNNTTSNNTNSTTSKSSSKKSKSSESSDDSGDYHYSAQYGTYIKEWDDGHGNSYMRSKNGEFYEHYNERTGFYEYNYPGEGYVHN